MVSLAPEPNETPQHLFTPQKAIFCIFCVNICCVQCAVGDYMTLQFMHDCDICMAQALRLYRLLLAWQNTAPAACCATHIGSGADILAPRQLHSPGGFAVNYNHNHYHNSADIYRRLSTTTTARVLANNTANTAVQLLQLQQLHCVVTRSRTLTWPSWFMVMVIIPR